MTTLAEFVREAREELGMTQEQLDEASGMSIGYTGMLEIGRIVRPKAKTIKALAAALHVAPETISNIINDIAPESKHQDAIQALLRIDQLPNRAARMKAFRSLSPDLRRAIRQIAHDLDGVDGERDEE